MSYQAVLRSGRSRAESLMVDACRITRGGTRTFNPGDGTYTTTGGSTVYEGKCRIQIPQQIVAGGADEKQAGQREWTSTFYMLMLPVEGSEAVRIEDLVTITSSTNDTAMLNKALHVSGLHTKSHATSRRLRCEEYTP